MQQMDEGRVDNAPYTPEQLKARQQLLADLNKADEEYALASVRPATFIAETTMGQRTGFSGTRPGADAPDEVKPSALQQERLPDAHENKYAGQPVSGTAEEGRAGVPAKVDSGKVAEKAAKAAEKADK